MEIRALRPGDDRSAFSSGSEALDRFFRHYAGQNQFRNYLGVTYLAVEDSHILGFLTVAPGHLEAESLPPSTRKRAPRHPLPILRLAGLAVDRTARSRGLGSQLLRFACKLASKMAGEFGCTALVVDAKPEAVSFYERYGFIAHDAVEGLSDSRPQPRLMFLPLQAINAALRTRRQRP